MWSQIYKNILKEHIKMEKKKIFNWTLLACVVGLFVVCFMSIFNEIHFDELRRAREEQVIKRLMQLRDAQEKYRISNGGKYCDDIDSLIYWVKNERAIDKVIKDGDLTDEMLADGLTEQEAVRRGLIRRDTVYISAYEALGISNPDSLKLVPIGREGALIQLKVRGYYNERAQQDEQLCEIRANIDDYMDGADSKMLSNYKDELKKRYKSYTDFDDSEKDWFGLRMGDLNDSSNKMAGNWE